MMNQCVCYGALLFGLTSFGMGGCTPMPHYHQAPVVKKPKPEKCDIQKENLEI